MTEYYTAQLQQQMISEVAYIAFMVVLMIVVAVALWNLAMYVMEAVGLYTIARRRGLKNPWMAWVPVLNHWLLGCVSDQYRYVAKGQIRSRRVALLVLVLVTTIIGWISNAMSMSNLTMIAESIYYGYPVYATGGAMGGSLSAAALVGAASLAISTALKVFRYMALYDVYTSCDTKNNIMYLVLGIIFNFLNPVFLYISRNKEEGMPPRREQPPCEIVEEEFAEV